ncbi:MAG: pnp 2 [Anaerospora sp.]|nr:pnp 2 [Anaerospora sp.]
MSSMSIEVGSVVEGVVTGITNFGAFVELPGGKVGLVHISEVADVYVRDVKDFLKEQDRVKVKVLSVDERGKIGLSIKQLTAPVNPGPRKPHTNDNRRPNRFNSLSFEDKLNKFLKDSDERLTDLKRNTDSKRGGRGGARRAE